MSRPFPGAGWAAVLAAAALGGAGGVDAQQVVPQRGQVSTEMDADSLSMWSVDVGALSVPLVGNEAFDRLGAGFGAQGGLVARFVNGFAGGLAARWLRLPDDLADGAATLVDVTVKFLWTHDPGPWRVEAGPAVGWVRLSRDVLTRSHSGSSGGAGVRFWRRLGPRTAVGVSGDLLWARFGELDFVVDLPRDPDQMAYGQLGSIALLFSVDLGGPTGETRVGTDGR